MATRLASSAVREPGAEVGTVADVSEVDVESALVDVVTCAVGVVGWSLADMAKADPAVTVKAPAARAPTSSFLVMATTMPTSGLCPRCPAVKAALRGRRPPA